MHININSEFTIVDILPEQSSTKYRLRKKYCNINFPGASILQNNFKHVKTEPGIYYKICLL